MTNHWPTWATQPIEIRPWDPTWLHRAAELVSDLESQLAPWLDGSIEHVGSTAVPGLAGKDLIDLMAPVTSFALHEPIGEVLAEAGWHLVPPEIDHRPWRRLHVLAEDDRRVAHLQLVETGHVRWRETLAFRDQLRQDRALVSEYVRVKRLAAQAHENDREAYTQAKASFVREVIGNLP